MYRIIWITVGLAAIGAGQTQVDLRRQSKSVDFSAASSTKPIATGTSLPSTCGVGQMYFLSGAPAGQNVYGCVVANTWALQSGGGGGGGSGVGVESAGTLVGTRSTFNFPSGGTCMATALADTGTVINITPSVNTALCPSDAILQGGSAPNICTSVSGSGTSYTAACATTLTALAARQVLWWHIDHVSASTAPTLNVDGLGAQPVTDSLGNALATATTLAAGMQVPVWNDGTHFRVMTLPAGGGGGSSTFLYTSGAQSAISTPPSSCGSEPCASDTLIWDSGALTSLPAGGCYELEWWVSSSNPAGSDNWTLWFGTSIGAASSVISDSGTQAGPYHFQGVICNLAGVQNSQAVVYNYTVANLGGVSPLGTTGTMAQSTTGNNLHIFFTNATNNGSGVTTNTTPIHTAVKFGQ